MQKEKQLVPKLRFLGFEGEWENKKLGDVAEFSKGKGISKSDIIEEGKNECIRYGELYTTYNEVINSIKSKTNIPLNISVLSEENDVIIPSSGETQLDIATASCVLVSGVILGGDLNIIKSELNGVFLSYLLNNSKKKDIARLAQGNSVVHLYNKQLSLLKLNTPTSKEQQKIANFLTAIDHRIQTLEQKKTLLEHYKKGVMQKIFKQELRFSDDNGKAFPEWEVKKLGEVCNIVKGKQLNKEELTEFGIYPCQNGGVYPSGYTDDYNTDKNTITLSEGGNSCGYVNFMETKFWCGGHCYSLLDLKNKIDVYFLYQYLKFNEKRIMRLRVGSGLPNIQKRDIESFKIKFPSLPEQTKIANFLSAIDKNIALVNTKIEHTKSYKKGLLQKMFV